MIDSENDSDIKQVRNNSKTQEPVMPALAGDPGSHRIRFHGMARVCSYSSKGGPDRETGAFPNLDAPQQGLVSTTVATIAVKG